MKTKIVYLAMGLFLSAVAVYAEVWSTNLPCFHGGSYDGWDRQATVAYASLASQSQPGTIMTIH